MNIALWSKENLRNFGDYDAIVTENGTWRSTAVHDQASRLAAALVARGMTPGDRVVLLVPNGGALIVAFTAALLAGGIAVPLFAGATADELARVLDECKPFAVVADRTTSAAMAVISARVRVAVGGQIEADGWDMLETVVASAEPLADLVTRDLKDPALICYTGGSSGTPRGVVYTHGGLRARRALTDHKPKKNHVPVVVLASLPMGTMGAAILTTRLSSKVTVVTLNGFEPRRFVDAIERHRVNALTIVPAMAEAILALPDIAKRDLRSLRFVTVGGAHVPRELIQRLSAVLPVRPVVGYGMTEAGGGISLAVRAAHGNGAGPISAGVAIPGVDVRVCNEMGEDTAQGEVGEILVRTPWMSAGYYGKPEQTANLFQNGWLRTGDLGYVDSSSQLYIVGRRKEMIIQGGVNVYSSEVEAAVRTVAGVATCAVVGAPNQFLGEEVVAFVVPEPGLQVSGERVIAECRRIIDARKAPARVVLISKLPVTAAGKVNADELRRLASDRRTREHTALHGRLQRGTHAERISNLCELICNHMREIRGGDDEPCETVDGSHCERTFNELGLDSLQMVRLCYGLGAALGCEVSPLLSFGHPTINSLADRLDAELSKDIRQDRLLRLQKVPTRGAVAIVGIGCRLPSADGPSEAWRLLAGGIDATDTIRRPVLQRALSVSGSEIGSVTTRAALLDDPFSFDAEFFDLTRREAALIDPQQRLLLEVTWEALEDAGWNPLSLAGTSTGVFIGMGGSDDPAFDGLGGAPSMATARICHFLDLHGPAAVIDTACSSSLFAVHCAVGSLRNGECDAAIAGGVSVIGSPRSFLGLSRLGAIAPDGRSKPFDAGADGYGRGEGCVLFVLKRLADAKRDDDTVLAVIAGSAAVHDGRSASLTAPNGRAQEQAIRLALHDAGVEPSSVDYLEAHGTGTPIGDPIEVGAATAVLGHPSRRLVIGSIKSNVGHLEAAAGAAGLLKVVLALRHGQIPPNLHLRRLNPLLEPFGSTFVVPTTTHPWPASPDRPRIAGVTSTGLSGTNVHVIIADELQDASTDVSLRKEAPKASLLCISARTDYALDQQIRRFADHLGSVAPGDFADCCLTSAVGRAPFRRRAAIVASTAAEARAELLAHLKGDQSAVSRGTKRTDIKVAFLFTGHGTQYVGMGRTLYTEHLAFRKAMQRCAEILRPLMSQPLLVGLGLEGPNDPDTVSLDDLAFAQPAIVAFEWALTEAWRAWGVSPTHVLGHSVGECTAAAVSGVLSLDDALRLAAARGTLLRSIAGTGRMAAVRAPANHVEHKLLRRAARVAIAADNGPQNTVVSGYSKDVEEAVADMMADGLDVKWLSVPAASHSPVTDSIVAEVERVARTLTYMTPRLPVASTLTGRLATSQELCNAVYWRRQIRESVKFADAVSALVAEGCNTFVEVGPHPTLLGTSQDVAGGHHCFVATQRRDRDAYQQMLTGLGELFTWGLEPKWAQVYGERSRRRAAMPTYAFDHDQTISQTEALHDGVSNSGRGSQSVAGNLRQRVFAADEAERRILLETWIRDEFALATGVLADDIAAEQSCLELGVDSLRLVDLAARIRTTLGVTCTPADIISRPTSASLSLFLHESLSPGTNVAASASQQDHVPAVHTRVDRTPPHTHHPLVALHTNGTQPPLICVHPAGGRISCYLRLRALLGDDRPVYALQSRALAGPNDEYRSIGEMSTEYASLVESACEPPYELFGWSMGGLIAHAMATEMERRGIAIKRVTMIDARSPRRQRHRLADRVFGLIAWLVEMRPTLSIDAVQTVLQRRDLSSTNAEGILSWCEEMNFVTKGSVTASALERDLLLYEKHFALAADFHPQPVTATVDQWWVEPGPKMSAASESFGTNVHQHIVSGTHFSVIQPPTIERIVESLFTAQPTRGDRF